jgi:hypothetical protein
MRWSVRANDQPPWTDAELKALRQLVRLELPMRTIARKLDRTEEAVRQKSQRVALADMRAGF